MSNSKPLVIISRPAMVFNVVDFPQRSAPSKTVMEPARKVSERFSTALTLSRLLTACL